MPNPENLKPPWKPGQPSPNPAGRPKGSKNLSTILREMLEEEVEVQTDAGKERKKLQEVMIRRLLRAATKSGDLKPTELKAIQEIFDRVEGKAKQLIETTEIPAPFLSNDPLSDESDKANNSPSEDFGT